MFGWTADEPTSFAILDAFVALGGNAIDTADGYSYWVPGHQGGESETVIGRWLKQRGRRDDVIIGTKVGWWEKRKGIKRANIIEGCEDSLQRLGVETIDLYWLHRDDEQTRARRIPRCARHARQRRQGARRRRIELRRCAVQGSARGERARSA